MTLAGYLMDQHILSILRQRAMIEKSVIAEPTLAELELLAAARIQRQCPSVLPPIRYAEAVDAYSSAAALPSPFGHGLSINASSKLPFIGTKTQIRGVPAAIVSASSGVYFNDKEVANTMHPAGTRFSNKVCHPPLPVGNPLPQPPRLAASGDEHKGIIVAEPAKRKIIDENEVESPGPNKRVRREGGEAVRDPAPDAQKSLSNEQKSFLEAALALSESSGRGESESATSKKSPILLKSPKSVVQGLPPPPFFLASNPLDIKESFTVSRKRTPSPRF